MDHLERNDFNCLLEYHNYPGPSSSGSGSCCYQLDSSSTQQQQQQQQQQPQQQQQQQQEKNHDDCLCSGRIRHKLGRRFAGGLEELQKSAFCVASFDNDVVIAATAAAAATNTVRRIRKFHEDDFYDDTDGDNCNKGDRKIDPTSLFLETAAYFSSSKRQRRW